MSRRLLGKIDRIGVPKIPHQEDVFSVTSKRYRQIACETVGLSAQACRQPSCVTHEWIRCLNSR